MIILAIISVFILLIGCGTLYYIYKYETAKKWNLVIRLKVYTLAIIAVLMICFGSEGLTTTCHMSTTAYQPKIRAEINNNKHLRYHISKDKQITDKENKHMLKRYQKKILNKNIDKISQYRNDAKIKQQPTKHWKQIFMTF